MFSTFGNSRINLSWGRTADYPAKAGKEVESNNLQPWDQEFNQKLYHHNCLGTTSCSQAMQVNAQLESKSCHACTNVEVNKTCFWSGFLLCRSHTGTITGYGSTWQVLTGAPGDVEVFPQLFHLYSCGCLFPKRMKSILCLHMCVAPLVACAWIPHGIHQHLPAAVSWHGRTGQPCCWGWSTGINMVFHCWVFIHQSAR